MNELELVYEVTTYGQMVYCEKTPATNPLHFQGVLGGPEINYDIHLLLFCAGKLVDHRLLSYPRNEVYFILNTIPLQLIAHAQS